jgi:hypothetical protein
MMIIHRYVKIFELIISFCMKINFDDEISFTLIEFFLINEFHYYLIQRFVD